MVKKVQPAYTDAQRVPMSTRLVHTNWRHQGNAGQQPTA